MQIRVLCCIVFASIILHAESFTLADLCKKGLENNPKISSFTNRTSASKAAYSQSIDQYKPQINLSGQVDNQDYFYTSTFGNDQQYDGTLYNYKIALTQAIYSAKLLEMITDSKARQVLTGLQEEDERAKLVIQILQVSVELLKIKQSIAILEKKVSLLQKANTNIDKKYQLQLAPQADKYQSLAMLQQAKSQLLNEQKNYNYNLYNLRLLTKFKDVEKYLTSIKFNMPAIEKAYKTVRLSQLKAEVDNNTRVKLDQQTVQLAKIQIDLSNSEWKPTVNAVVSYNDSTGTIDNVTRQNESHAIISVGFPIYQGGYVDDRVEEASFLHMAAVDDAENSRLNIDISIEKALQNIQGGLESFKSDTLAVMASKKFLDSSILNYQNGTLSLTDVYLAEIDYHDNELRMIENQATIFTSLLEINYYIGRSNYKGVQTLQKKFF